MSTRDLHTGTETDAGKSARNDAYETDDREYDEPGAVTKGVRGPLIDAALLAFRQRLEEAGSDKFVCDSCLGLYDPNEGCVHSRYLCEQCVADCRDCVYERTQATAAERAAERWRS